MGKNVMAGVVLMLVFSLVLGGCAPAVPQEEYDSVLAELTAVQAGIADLQAEIEDLSAELETLPATTAALQDNIADLEAKIEEVCARPEAPVPATSAAEAWDRAHQRHTAVMQNIPFADELVELAPWIEFPDKPAWFDSIRLCSAILVEETEGWEGVCIATAPGQASRK